MKLKLDYPEVAQEEEILSRHHGRVDDRLDDGADVQLGALTNTAACRQFSAALVTVLTPALVCLHRRRDWRRTREGRRSKLALGASSRAGACYLMQLGKAGVAAG